MGKLADCLGKSLLPEGIKKAIISLYDAGVESDSSSLGAKYRDSAARIRDLSEQPKTPKVLSEIKKEHETFTKLGDELQAKHGIEAARSVAAKTKQIRDTVAEALRPRASVRKGRQDKPRGQAFREYGFETSAKSNKFAGEPVADKLGRIYRVLHMDEMAQSGKDLLEKLGTVDKAVAYFVNPETPFSSEYVAGAIELTGRLQNAGRFEEEATVIKAAASRLNDAGQAVKAAHLMAFMSPSGIEWYAIKCTEEGAIKDPRVKEKMDQAKNFNDRVRQQRKNNATKAVNKQDYPDLLKDLGVTNAELLGIQQAVVDVLTNTTTGSEKSIKGTIKSLLTKEFSISQENAEKVADRAWKHFDKHQKASRKMTIENLFAVNPRKFSKDKMHKWLQMNEEGLLTDEQLNEYVAKEWKIPHYGPTIRSKIQKLTADYHKATNPTTKLVKAGLMLQAIHELVPSDAWTKVKSIYSMVLLLNPKTTMRNVIGPYALAMFDIAVADQVARFVVDPVTTGVRNAVSYFNGGEKVDRTILKVHAAKRLWAIHSAKGPRMDFKAGYEFASGGVTWMETMKRKARGEELGFKFKDAFKEGIESMLIMGRLSSGQKYEIADIKKGFRHAFSNPFAQKLEDALSFSLSVPDRVFFTEAYQQSIDRRMDVAWKNGNHLLSPTPEMVAEAILDANRAVFQEENWGTDAVRKGVAALNRATPPFFSERFGVGTAMIPFQKVSVNIVFRGAEYTPLGFLRTLHELSRPAFKHESFNQKRFVDAFSRALAGSASVFIGYVLAKLGLVRGLPDEDEDREAFMKASGFGALSVNASGVRRSMLNPYDMFRHSNWEGPVKDILDKGQKGDTIVTFDWMQPFAMSFAIGAQIAIDGDKAKKENWWGSFLSGTEASYKIVEKQPVMQGFTNFTNAVAYGFRDSNNNVIKGLAAGALQGGLNVPMLFVPTALGETRQMTDNYRRETRIGGPLDQMWAHIADRIPGLSYMNPVRYDLKGEAQELYQHGTNSFFNAFFNPAWVSKLEARDRTATEIENLYSIAPERIRNQIIPDTQRKINTILINDQERSLTAQEVSHYQYYSANLTNAWYDRMFASPQFNRLPPEVRFRELNSVKEAAHAAAKVALFGNRPKTLSQKAQIMLFQARSWGLEELPEK